ncbi:MAG: methyltransferase domain-containing protein, partial [Caldilineaceae bacterium]|nr:methyltransferase domain-containing protein [Caldilineaceae bacterium]
MGRRKRTTLENRAGASAGGFARNDYEVEVAPGLEQVTRQELQQVLGRQLSQLATQDEQAGSGVISFTCRSSNGGELERILQLNTVFNAYRVLTFPIARPKGLLAHAHLGRLVDTIRQLQRRFPPGYFTNFGINAAGAESLVFRQLAVQLAGELALPFSTDENDLLLRVRPTPAAHARADTEWQVLIRLSSRPLSVRAWRVADMKGALNAAVAHAMVRLTHPQTTDKFLNLTCGSGTLLVERLLATPARRVIGCDIDAGALQYAEANLRAAGVHDVVELYDWDARALNLPDHSVDAICADLPFGIAVGAHATNVSTYPAILQEAARVIKP